jgi:hypothetical protein
LPLGGGETPLTAHFRIKAPALAALVLGYSVAALVAAGAAFKSSRLSSQLLLALAALLCASSAAFVARARVVLREDTLEIRRLLRSITIRYSDIVRSIVIFDSFDEAVQGLHVQRRSGNPVRLSTEFWSRADRRRLFSVPELRVEHHDGSERFV